MSTVLFFILMIAPLLGALSLSFFVRRWTAQPNYTALKRLAVVLLIATPVLAIWSLYNFGGGFGGGMVFYCTAIPAALIVIVELVRQSRLWGGWNKRQRRHFALTGLATLAFVAAPNLGTLVIGGACNAMNRAGAAPIIDALNLFQQQHDALPEKADVLVPTYLDALPATQCFEPYDWFKSEPPSSLLAPQRHPYKVVKCQTGETLLTVESIALDNIQRYNLATGNWSSISFLDGDCNFLR